MKRASVEFLHGDHRGELLAGFHLHEVRDRLALAVGADIRDLVDLQPVGAAAIREDHHVGVRRGHEQVIDDVLFARPHADAALAAAVLRAIGRDRRALDVAGIRDRHRDVFLGDQVFDAELALFLDQLCAARIGKLRLHGAQFVENDLQQQRLVREDVLELGDQLVQRRQFTEDLVALQAGQALQLHVEDCLRLDFGEAELRDQPDLGFRRVLRAAD